MLKSVAKTRVLTVVPANVPFIIFPGDKKNLEGATDFNGSKASSVQRKTFNYAVHEMVKNAFPQGMNRADGKAFIAWMEAFEGEGEELEVPYVHVDWLVDLLGKDDLAVQPAMAQWREAILSYLKELMDGESQAKNEEGKE